MQDLQLYNYSTWQPRYARNTFKSIVVDLPQDFAKFLQEDGIVVSSGTKAVRTCSWRMCTLLSCIATSVYRTFYVYFLAAEVSGTPQPPYRLLAVCCCCCFLLQLPQRGKPAEVVVEGVDYDPEDNYSSEDEQPASESGSVDSQGSQDHLPWSERFPKLHAEIESAIQQLGGQVAPKLNWSSPTDALWISSYNSLKCCNADQVGS